MTFHCIVAVAVIAAVALVACGESGGENVDEDNQVERVEFPKDGVTCYVYDSRHDAGSGISCVVTP